MVSSQENTPHSYSSQKTVLKQKRAECNAGLLNSGGHNIEYYYREILQYARRTKNKRSLSRWNAFVRQEIKHINDGISEGENHHKAAQHAAEISACWKGMTKEERKATTEGAMIELVEQCKSKALAPHNIPLNSFEQDTAKHRQPGTEILLIAVHADVDHFNRPMPCKDSYTGFTGVEEKMSGADHAKMLNITQKYHLVLENWPLSKFVAPGNINSLTELRVLYNAWDSNASCFHKLSDEEFKAWEAKKFADVLALASTLHDTDEEDFVAEGENNAPGPQLLSNSVTKSPANPPLQPSDCNASIAAPKLTQTRKCKVASETPAESVVFAMDGAFIQVTKKLRRERTDKGVKCGPRKKKGDTLAVVSSDGPSHSTDNTRDLLDAPPRGGMLIML
ncbi:hypothetical protein BDR07DRAFT_1370890 [Suillus spraguei]|nr:hypothetical protein BDR07DRAFT_1370890 [Suillus spraguei]